MKKILSILLTIIMTMSFMTACSAEEQTTDKVEAFALTMQIGNPVMTVNGESKNIDDNGTVPVIENSRTLVPIRAIIEAMGGSVQWDNDTRTATLDYSTDEIKLTIDSTMATLNNEEKTLDVAPKIINNRTMLPIRFIAESFKFAVGWDEKTQTITVSKETAESAGNEKGGKTLVVYYSATV